MQRIRCSRFLRAYCWQWDGLLLASGGCFEQNLFGPAALHGRKSGTGGEDIGCLERNTIQTNVREASGGGDVALAVWEGLQGGAWHMRAQRPCIATTVSNDGGGVPEQAQAFIAQVMNGLLCKKETATVLLQPGKERGDLR